MPTDHQSAQAGPAPAGAGAKAVEEILRAWHMQAPATAHTGSYLWARRAINLLAAVHAALWHSNPAYTRDDLIQALSVAWIEAAYRNTHSQSQAEGGNWPPHMDRLRRYVEQGMHGYQVDVLLRDGPHKQNATVYGHHYYLTTILSSKLYSKN